MNNTIQWKMNERIAERPKLLIWLENTYKHKEKKNARGGPGKVRVGSRRGIWVIYWPPNDVHAFGSTILFKKESSHQILVSSWFNFIIGNAGLNNCVKLYNKENLKPHNSANLIKDLCIWKCQEIMSFGYVKMSESWPII